MDLQDFVGHNIEEVKAELDKFGLKYRIVESSNIQKKFDTILVTRISKNDESILIVTDKFLLKI